MNKALLVDGLHVHSRKWAKPLKKYGKYYTAFNGTQGISLYETALKNESPFNLVFFEDAPADITAEEFVSKVRQLEEEYQAKPAILIAFRDEGYDGETLESCDEYYSGEFDKEWLIQTLDEKYQVPRRELKQPYRGFGKSSY